MKRRRNRGQILLPGLAFILVQMFLFILFLAWATRSLRQMRLNLAADAAALSCARAQAEMLNTIASSNVMINLFVQKAQIPLIPEAVGVMKEENWPGYKIWQSVLEKQVRFFSLMPAAVGRNVARMNGGQGVPLSPIRSHLNPQNIHVAIILSHPPFLAYEYLNAAYYARAWWTDKLKPQPPHQTTWTVIRGRQIARSKARLWLDVQPSDWLNNGGFPRAQDQWWRNAFIQNNYPQFNARLAR